MARVTMWVPATLNRQAMVNSARTAFAATFSLIVARVFRLPETYWAAITTLIVMQSTLGAALTVSWKRLVGTALGAFVAAFATTYIGPNALAFGGLVFGIGLLSSALHLDRTAYRFASITLAIVMLIAHTRPAWVVATHRFIEVSVGIAVALALTAIWPEPEPISTAD